MTWQGERRKTLPTNWSSSIQPAILKRDPICQLRYDCCTGRSTQVDHIGEATDHRPHMLRGVCEPCHKRRTQEQAQAARKPRTRSAPPHPGVIR